MNRTDIITIDEVSTLFCSDIMETMSNKGNGAQSSKHVTETTYSDDDGFRRFFDNVVPKSAQLHLHPAAVSIFTDQETHSVDTSNTETYKNHNFTEASQSLE